MSGLGQQSHFGPERGCVGRTSRSKPAVSERAGGSWTALTASLLRLTLRAQPRSVKCELLGLGGEWICAAAGTPGTWRQIRLAAVVADPGTGTIPVGYCVWSATDGAVKRHAGSYSWEITVGVDASAKVGFHGATPTAQAAHIPDPSGGSTVDTEARAAINAILLALEGKGFVAGS